VTVVAKKSPLVLREIALYGAISLKTGKTWKFAVLREITPYRAISLKTGKQDLRQ
jgi:hypothetical protein